MDTFVEKLSYILMLMRNNSGLALLLVGFLWGIFLLNLLTKYRLNLLGIYPRTLIGLPGILFAPFLHANFKHLFFNSIPLLLFFDFILMMGLVAFIKISITIVLISGIAIWIFGRSAIHLGASGLLMGYFGYLLFKVYHDPSLMSALLALVSIYYFGGLLFSLVPNEEEVSWEGHLFGFLAGLIAVELIH